MGGHGASWMSCCPRALWQTEPFWGNGSGLGRRGWPTMERGEVALTFLERQLRDELERLGRRDLAEAAAGRITFPDDGATVYLHPFPREGWPRKHPGQAFVLDWADDEEICGLAGFRELVRLGRLAIRAN